MVRDPKWLNMSNRNEKFCCIIHSDETRSAISVALLAFLKNNPEARCGVNNSMYGRSGDMSPRFGKRGDQCPVYGKRWVTDGIQTRYISQDESIPEGFYLGRTLPLCRKGYIYIHNTLTMETIRVSKEFLFELPWKRGTGIKRSEETRRLISTNNGRRKK
jgi:hypothetical protein